MKKYILIKRYLNNVFYIFILNLDLDLFCDTNKMFMSKKIKIIIKY